MTGSCFRRPRACRRRRYCRADERSYPPQLFDLEKDPEELIDQAANPEFAGVLEDCRQRLYAICDPDEIDRRAKARQAELLARNGGRDAVIARGDLGFTPAPGAAFAFD
jgi:choline-sulfatase